MFLDARRVDGVERVSHPHEASSRTSYNRQDTLMRPRRRNFKFRKTPSQHQQVQHLLRVHDGLAEVRHQPDERRVPLVRDFCKGGRAGRHEHLSYPILEGSEGLLVDLRIGSNLDQ